MCVHLASETIRGNPKDCPGEQVPEKQITQTAHGCVVTSCAADLTVTSVMSTINLLTFWNQEFSTHSHLYLILQPGNSSVCKKKRAFWGADVAVAWVIVRPRQLINTPLYALIIIKGALILRIATPDIYRSHVLYCRRTHELHIQLYFMTYLGSFLYFASVSAVVNNTIVCGDSSTVTGV